MELSGNTIFIPGSTSGIGRGLAERFAAAGSQVIVSGRRSELVEEVAAGNDNISGLVLDVTDPASIEAAVETIERDHPDTNVLVTSVGIMEPEDLHDSAFLDVAERTITTNLLGPIRLIAALTRQLASQDRAAILTVSSGLAFVPLPSTPTYSATKAAIHSFTESMRVQFADTAIEVIEIAPPAVRTTLMNQEDSPHAMPLEEFLDETMSLLGGGESNGEVLVENVKRMRFAEASGTYGEVLEMLSAPR